jgi:hypothetical protein
MIAPALANATDIVANDTPPNPENTSSESERSQLIASSTTLPIAAVTLIAQTTATENRACETIAAIFYELGCLGNRASADPRLRTSTEHQAAVAPSQVPHKPGFQDGAAAVACRPMNNSLTTYSRRGGTVLIAGAVLTIAGALLSAILQGSSSVPDDLVRYPFSHDAFLPFTVFAAACHLLMLAGIIYLARGGLAGGSRTGKIGLGCVIAGLAMLFVGEWAQLPFAGQHTSSTGPSIVDGGFGLATLLLAGGMMAVGVATLRRSSWGSWRRYAPLACGVLSVVVIPIQFTSALWVGITVLCLGYLLLGAAVVSDSAHGADHAIKIA